MEQLKKAWVYRFWIVVGIVVIMPIVGFFVDTSSLAKNAKQQEDKLKSKKQQLEGALKGPHPNEKWSAGVEVLKKSLSEQVDVAWVDLYERQAKIMTWPEAVRDVYVQAGPDGDVGPDVKLDYQKLYRAQIDELFVRVKAGTVVEIPKAAIITKFRPSWLSASAPPTVAQAWLAQEDVWLLRAILDVIGRANKESTKVNDSPVKRILDIEIGSKAVDSRLSSKGSTEQLSAPKVGGGAAGPGGASKSDLRYIEGQLFQQVPIYLKLTVDQRELPAILAEFNNSDIPMQVRQVSFAAASERAPLPGTSVAKSASQESGERGFARAKDDEYFNMTELDVWAHAFLYKAPSEATIKAVKAAAVAAAAQPTTQEQPAGEANPTDQGQRTN
jgi:hypothetical protein